MSDVDLSALDGLDEILGSRAETAEMLREFLVHAQGWTSAIERETQCGASTEGYRAAHTLATSAASVGAHALSRVARDLEHRFETDVLPDGAARARADVLLREARAAWIEAGRIDVEGST